MYRRAARLRSAGRPFNSNCRPGLKPDRIIQILAIPAHAHW